MNETPTSRRLRSLARRRRTGTSREAVETPRRLDRDGLQVEALAESERRGGFLLTTNGGGCWLGRYHRYPSLVTRTSRRSFRRSSDPLRPSVRHTTSRVDTFIFRARVVLIRVGLVLATLVTKGASADGVTGARPGRRCVRTPCRHTSRGAVTGLASRGSSGSSPSGSSTSSASDRRRRTPRPREARGVSAEARALRRPLDTVHDRSAVRAERRRRSSSRRGNLWRNTITATELAARVRLQQIARVDEVEWPCWK